MKQGESSLYPCPFCMRGYKKNGSQKGKKRAQVIEEENENKDAQDEHNHVENREWDRSMLHCPMLEEPDRLMKDTTWIPIIAFSLDNVHFCTLHAFMQIFDRLLKLHIDYAFTMKQIQQSREALSKVEELLNSLGCHRGNV